MITILESSYVILHTIVLAVISKKSTMSTVVPRMVLFCVILPYAFLMNTCHNKNRIMDMGWSNVIKNIMGWKDKSLIVTSNNKKGTTENKQDLPPLTSTGSTVKHRKKQQRKIRRGTEDLNQNKIFVISTVQNNIMLNDIAECSELPTSINVGASTSAGLKTDSSNKRLCCSNNKFGTSFQGDKIPPNLEKTSSLSDDESDISHRYNIEEINSTLIELMLDSVKNEDVYIPYLKKLIEIHDDGKKESYSQKTINELVIHETPCYTYSNKYKQKVNGGRKAENVTKQSSKTECLLNVRQNQAKIQ